MDEAEATQYLEAQAAVEEEVEEERFLKPHN